MVDATSDKVVYCVRHGQSEDAAAIENTELAVLRYQVGVDEGPCWRLWIYNDHAHLAE